MRRGFSLRLKPAAELAWRPLRQRRRRRRRRCRVRGGAVVAVAAARSLPVVSLSPRDAKSRRRQLTRLVPGRSWPRPRMGEGRLTRRCRHGRETRATAPRSSCTERQLRCSLLVARGMKGSSSSSPLFITSAQCDASGTALKTSTEYTGVGAVHRDESTAGECEDCEAPELK
ncbi:unnamed protein product [Lampetra planeri]